MGLPKMSGVKIFPLLALQHLASTHTQQEVTIAAFLKPAVLISELSCTDFMCSPTAFTIVSQKVQKKAIAYIQIKVNNGYSKSQIYPEHSGHSVNTM